MKIPSNNVGTVVKHYSDQIGSLYPQKEANAIIWLLMDDLFEINRFALASNPDLRLSESELLLIHKACKKILQNIPVQYVTGKSEFFGLQFKVNESVLIPRPETEQLAQIIFKELPLQPVRILDIGVGSGAIVVSLKKNRPDCILYGCDISSTALETARENARIHETDIHFFECDILSNAAVKLIPDVDVIVSNPPYVCQSEKALMRSNVLQNEPHDALFVPDDNPLLFYKTITGVASERLSSEGKLFFEINERFGEEVAGVLQKYSFTNISILKDFNDKDRFVKGEKE
ncbi:MAG: peptide chain release factor N(5)-glutamine methyltransferase [Bacteroidales bacterium]|jgi:release factor glutamine methyltransferase|nr:peptide chain release factor N(5)-glutamine methyltransferase [Bacteroidales bacterium]